MGPAHPPLPGAGSALVPRLHLVTDDEVLARPGFLDEASALLAGVDAPVALHVRGPATPGGTLLRAAAALVAAAAATDCWVVVNDRVDVALAAGAHGAHLGARSLPVAEARRILGAARAVGVSVHARAEGAEAAAHGTAWIFAGTIYETPSHPGRPGRGPALVTQVADAAGAVPVLAIGGVTAERVAEVVEAGAWGAAVIRGVWDAPDPVVAAGRYLHALAGAAGGGAAGLDPEIT